MGLFIGDMLPETIIPPQEDSTAEHWMLMGLVDYVPTIPPTPSTTETILKYPQEEFSAIFTLEGKKNLHSHLLPVGIRCLFANKFVPCIISKASYSYTGTVSKLGFYKIFLFSFTPTITLQLSRAINLRYWYLPLLAIYYQHILMLPKANSRVMSFRNTIARWATENVQVCMKHFNMHETEEYIASVVSYHGEIPFLYQTFKVIGEVEPDHKQKCGGYKFVNASPVSPSDPLSHLPTGLSWTFLSPCYPSDDGDLLLSN